MEHGHAPYLAVLIPVSQHVAVPGQRLPAARQPELDGLGIFLERCQVIGEGLPETAADVQHPRRQPGRPAPLEQLQATLDRQHLLPGLAAVQVKRQPAEVHHVRGLAQQPDRRVKTVHRDPEPAHPVRRPPRGAAEPAHPDQDRHALTSPRPGEPDDLRQFPYVVGIDGHPGSGQGLEEAPALGTGRFHAAGREPGAQRTDEFTG